MAVMTRTILLAAIAVAVLFVGPAAADDHHKKHKPAKWHGKHIGWTMRRSHRMAELSRHQRDEKKGLKAHQREERHAFQKHEAQQKHLAPQFVGAQSHTKEIMTGLRVHQRAEREQLKEHQKDERREVKHKR